MTPMAKTTGWQADGTYEPCDECRLLPEPDRDTDAPGVPIRMDYTAIHRGDCPKVNLSREAQERLDRFIDEADRCRARAAVEARTAWIA